MLTYLFRERGKEATWSVLGLGEGCPRDEGADKVVSMALVVMQRLQVLDQKGL